MENRILSICLEVGKYNDDGEFIEIPITKEVGKKIIETLKETFIQKQIRGIK